MRVERTRWATLVVLAPLLIVTPARAAPDAPSAPSGPAANQGPPDAEVHLREGLKRYSEHDYEGARAAFAEAYLALHSLDLLYNLARAELKSGHPVEALTHASQIFGSPLATPPARAQAGRLIDEAMGATGHIRVEAPEGTRIDLDGSAVGRAPLQDPINVVPGAHAIAATVDGRTRTMKIDVAAGNAITARFALDTGTVTAPVPLPTASLPTTTPAPTPPPAPTAPPPVVPESDHAESHARVLVPLVVGAVGVVALGFGVGFGIAAAGKQSDATTFRAAHPLVPCSDATNATCAQYAAMTDAQQQATDRARGFAVAGGTLVAGAIVTYLLWPRAHGERAAWVTPVPGGIAAGASF